VVQNVETLVNVPWIVERGPEAYRGLGTPSSAGTKALCLNQGFARPGIVEVEFGVSLREVIEGEAGGGAGGGALAAVLLGGPMGNVLTPGEWEVPVCYGAMAERGIQLGHGGLVALPETTDWAGLLVHLLEFLREESCGKCVPCREGSRLACELALRRDGAGSIDPASRPALLRLFEVMRAASLCAFGQCTPGPLATLVERFGERIFGAAGAAPGGVP
jgi:NADH:ubiquinone oxidoreductase subunit F (NADH-binding)